MNHSFYTKTHTEQNQILIKIGIGTFVIVLTLILVLVFLELYSLSFLILVISLSMVAPFFDVPFLKRSGKLIYYSPLFITEKPKGGILKIHGGTLFDYYFVIEKSMNGKQRTNFIIQQYLEGLLALMETYKADSTIKLVGTSYILNTRTAEKMGFKIVKTDLFQKFILAYNYINILISNSIAKDKLSFPNINETKTFEAEFSDLLAHKEYIEKLNHKLAYKMSNKGKSHS